MKLNSMEEGNQLSLKGNWELLKDNLSTAISKNLGLDETVQNLSAEAKTFKVELKIDFWNGQGFFGKNPTEIIVENLSDVQSIKDKILSEVQNILEQGKGGGIEPGATYTINGLSIKKSYFDEHGIERYIGRADVNVS